MRKKYFFDQYKIFVDSAEKNSDKRITQNNIFLTINLAFISFLVTQNILFKYLILFSIIGVFICVVWFLTISNYSKRNKVKYDIINEMEKDFGSLYSEEWKRIEVLTPLTFYEKFISILFLVIYVLIPVLTFVS